jgi:SNF2 family DNA or RNA helicase
MKMILEIQAREILSTYEGANNQLLDWKQKFVTIKNFKLTRTQAKYVLDYKDVVPKVARKYLKIFPTFAEKIMEEKRLVLPPEKIWCEKLLCETEKAYHIWGKVTEKENMYAFWLPKGVIILEEKKLKYEIDYSKFDRPGRPVMSHQKVAVEKLIPNDRFILADDMGLGKTTSAIIAAIESGAKKVLIVCPASLKINWKREIEMYTNRRTLIVEGGKWGSTFDFVIINYDIIKNYHSLPDEDTGTQDSLILREHFDLAIVDEAHYINNTGAMRTQLMNDILDTIPKVWLLTGTPMTSRPINYYNLLKIVKSPLTLNWQGYVKRYCKGFQFKANGRKVWKTDGAANLDELRERTKHVVLRRLKTDVLDLPEKIITPQFLELDNMLYQHEMEEFVKIAKDDRKKESISITLSRLMTARKIIAREKVPYTCELIDKFLELDKKVIVFTNFTDTLEMIKEKYSKHCVVVDGRTPKLKRQEAVDRFQQDPKVKVFIGNIIAAGVGLTLTAAEGVIMNDLSFVPSHHSQAEDRANRIGQKNVVNVYYPIFEDTIEINIYNIIQRKKNNIEQVMGDGEYSESFAKELMDEITFKFGR